MIYNNLNKHGHLDNVKPPRVARTYKGKTYKQWADKLGVDNTLIGYHIAKHGHLNMIGSQQAKKFKYSEIPSIPVLDEDEAVDFFENKSEWVFDRIVQAVTEGLFMNTNEVRLFELNGSGAYMTAEKSGWGAGIKSALEYYIAIEAYEKCTPTKQLLEKL